MYVNNARDIGLLVRDRRAARNLSQAALARQLGVRQAWVSDLENGKFGSRLDLVLAALNALGVRLWADIDDGAPVPGAKDGRTRDTLDMNKIIDDMLDDL